MKEFSNQCSVCFGIELLKCFILQSVSAQKHHIVNWQIADLAIRRDSAGIGQDEGFFHVVILVLYKAVQSAVDGVVLAGLDLDGDGGEAVVVVDQIIHLALAAVIIVEQLAAVGDELAGDDALIDRAEVDVPFILKYFSIIILPRFSNFSIVFGRKIRNFSNF